MDTSRENGFLKVKDVCAILNITPHTLRYWEKEFSEFLRPHRSTGGHRLYDDHQIRRLLEIKHLLKDRYFSIKGAKIYLQHDSGRGRRSIQSSPDPEPNKSTPIRREKQRWYDLAILGGVPAFEKPLHVGMPNIGDQDRFLKQAAEILQQRRLTNNGPLVQRFEEEIARLIGVKHVVATCNATVALEIAIRALDLSGEVIVPSMTFVATVHALWWQQIQPVFCDVNPHTYTLDPSCVVRKITSRTTGIIGVHLWGRPCAVDALEEIARHYRLKLLFDAAHALYTSYKGRLVGQFGDAEIFSFHATKFLNTFEGGAIATNDDSLAAKVRLMRNFGFAGKDHVIYIGTNGKMNEMAAAMGITSLESLQHFVDINYRNYTWYRKLLDGIPGIRLIPYDEREINNYQYIVVEVDPERAGLNRDQLVALLERENVLARRYFYPGVHRMEPYRTLFPDAGLQLPVTEALVERVMTLPTGTAVHPEDIRLIAQIIRLAVRHSKQLTVKFNQLNAEKMIA